MIAQKHKLHISRNSKLRLKPMNYLVNERAKKDPAHEEHITFTHM